MPGRTAPPQSPQTRSEMDLVAVFDQLSRNPQGLSADILDTLLGWERRAHLALGQLQNQGKVYEQGGLWFYVPNAEQKSSTWLPPVRSPPSDDDVRAEVEEALRYARRPLWLVDLTFRCRGRVAQIEAAADWLVERGRARKVQRGWVHTSPVVHGSSMTRPAAEPLTKAKNEPVCNVLSATTPPEKPAYRPSPPESIVQPVVVRRRPRTTPEIVAEHSASLLEQAPIVSSGSSPEEGSVVSEVSEYDALVPSVIAVIHAHPQGLDAVGVGAALGCGAAAASCALRLAWGKGLLHANKVGVNLLFFPPDVEKSNPERLEQHALAQEHTRTEDDTRGPPLPAPRHQKTAEERFRELVLKTIVYVNCHRQDITSRQLAEVFGIEPTLASRALRFAWERGFIEARGEKRGRVYSGLSILRGTIVPNCVPAADVRGEIEQKVFGAISVWMIQRDPLIRAHLSRQDLTELTDAVLKCVI